MTLQFVGPQEWSLAILAIVPPLLAWLNICLADSLQDRESDKTLQFHMAVGSALGYVSILAAIIIRCNYQLLVVWAVSVPTIGAMAVPFMKEDS